MNNQVIFYDRMNDTVKLIDGIKSISLKKAQQLGFTPKYLIRMACELLSLDKDPESQKALKITQAALKKCPSSQRDNVGNIISYDRMSDKIKIFGGAITIPFTVALHKGVTPAHLIKMAAELLSLNATAKQRPAFKAAQKAYKVCEFVQANQPKYQNKRYK